MRVLVAWVLTNAFLIVLNGSCTGVCLFRPVHNRGCRQWIMQ